MLSSALFGQLEWRPLRAAGELVTGGGVGALGNVLGALQVFQLNPARREVSIQLLNPDRNPQSGQSCLLGARAPEACPQRPSAPRAER